MGSLVLTGATSGATTITPSATGTYTITLPAETGTIQTSGAGFTTNGVAYATSTSALATGSALTFNGTTTTTPRLAFSGTTLPSAGTATIFSRSSDNNFYLQTGSGNNVLLLDGSQNTMYNVAPTFHDFLISGSSKMYLDSAGSLSVGVTGSSAYHRFFVNNLDNWTTKFANTNASSPYGITIQYDNASPNGTLNNFWNCQDSTTTRGKLVSNGGLYNYSGNNQNLSDRREKTNFAPATSYLDKICAIPVQTFNYIDQNLEEDGGLTLGVVAQDVQAIAPELVTESNWGSEDEPKMRLSIYQTDLQYALMKSIQELSTLITAQQSTIQSLTERITALENK